MVRVTVSGSEFFFVFSCGCSFATTFYVVSLSFHHCYYFCVFIRLGKIS